MGNKRKEEQELEKLHKKLEELARSYTPQWQFGGKHPDIGTVIALLFAEQMGEGRKRYDRLMELFHEKFINMLGISLLPARPACAVEIFQPNRDLDAGTFLRKGTKLLAENEEDVIFETMSGLYITDAEITHILQADGSRGVLQPLRGNFRMQEYAGEAIEADEPKEEEPFQLFSFPKHGIEKNALILHHRNIIRDGEDQIYLKLPGRGKLAERINAGEFAISFLDGNDKSEIQSCSLVGNTLVLRGIRPDRAENGKSEENEETALLIEALSPIKNSVFVDNIFLSFAGENHPAEFAGDGTLDMDVRKFAMFHDTLQLFAECYIGDNKYFAKSGAVVRITFDLSYDEHLVGAPPEPEDTDLRVIKRKPRVHLESAPAKTCVEEISIEYYNGTGWKRLIAEQNYKALFASGEAKKCELKFHCPMDWHPVQIGGFEGRCLRFRILKADNCYLTPCIHTVPVLKNLEISYSYEGKFEQPEQVQSLWGTQRTDLTALLRAGRGTAVFEPPAHTRNTLYIGFDRTFDGGPVSFYADLKMHGILRHRNLQFAYSSPSGFKSMKVLDGTSGFCRSGIVSFFPPDDMRPSEIEGVKRCWIRITDAGKNSISEYQPIVSSLAMNAVSVINIKTADEEDFYLDAALPNMEFTLGTGNILDAEVWVNEKDRCSESEMRALLKESPGSIRAEYNFLGEIQEFYVLWRETQSFSQEETGARCYLLDRMNGRLIFGDGVHVSIPRVTGSIAFKVCLRCCNGSEGNVQANTITEFASNTGFYGTMYNPYPAYGGSSIEEPENALLRGANLLSSRSRLVTRTDYLREVRAFSGLIDKVSCVVGQSVTGERARDIVSIVLLMKDFAEGAASFSREMGRLKEHLLERCEMTVCPDRLEIVEPIPIEISVEVWVKPVHEEDSFELQTAMVSAMEEFLNPVSDSRRVGWEIGALPSRPQILMKLNHAAGGSLIRNVLITGTCIERNGRWERELERIEPSPFYICRSGKHKIHIIT